LRMTAKRNRLFVAMSLFAAAVLVLVAVWLHHRSPSIGLPYRDTFGEGRADEWKAFGGTWELANGTMRNDSDERGAKLLTGSTQWRDYSVEADVMLLGLGGDAGLVIRSSGEEEGVDAYHGYYAGLRSVDDALAVGRADYGWTEIIFPLKPRAVNVVASRWYHLKLMAVGCTIATSLNRIGDDNFTVASVNDPDCIRAGRTGLRSYSSGGVWRNVVVQRATRQDLEQMLSHQHLPHAPAVPKSADDSSRFVVSLIPPQNNMPQALPSSPNTEPVSSLRFSSLGQPKTATIRGIVALASPALFVQDSTGGVEVRSVQPQALKVGDEVEVTGHVEARDFSSILKDATVRVLWEGTPTPAVSVTAAQAATGAFDATFIEVSGHLRQKEYGPDDTLVFDLASGPQSFRVILNRGRGNSLYKNLALDSMLRIRGVAVMDPAYTQGDVPFALLARSSDDFEVLAGPPWWSAGHLVIMGICLLLLAFIVNILYHRIENMRLQAVAEEREHLAYDMHDTLAQSVAGIGFQLEAIRINMPDELHQVHRQLDLASELVRHSHAEARRSIDMLRPQQLDSKGLLSALTHTAERLVQGGGVQVIAHSLGEPHILPLRINDALYRLGQEALANAVRHANPGKIEITLHYDYSAVTLTVSDDGAGFDHDAKSQGFGVQGMRKRAASISAKLEIFSAAGSGTQVIITAPLAPRLTLFRWPSQIRKLFQEKAPHAADTRSDSYLHRR
jgi:signal transduction histidine kinase